MKSPFLLALGLITVFGAVRFTLAEGRITPGLRQKLDNLPADQTLRIIIDMSDKMDLRQIKTANRTNRRQKICHALRDHARQSQQPLFKLLEKNRPRRLKSLWIINAVAVELSGPAIQQLDRLDGVQQIRLDEWFSLADEPADEHTFITRWNHDRIGVPSLWEMGYTGKNVVVANMDTGVDYEHPDLSGRWRGGTNSWCDPYNEHDTPYDNDGHGTETMGIMVAGDISGEMIGMAPDANWIAVKIFNDAKQASLIAVHEGFQWLLDPDNDPLTDDAPDVVNNSWGYDAPGACFSEFQADIEALKAAGIAVVFSAGNEGPNSSTDISPANNPPGFAVGSIDPDDAASYPSSRGPSTCDLTIFPEVTAPGLSIKSTTLSNGGEAEYADSIQGTSFSCPHVSGVIALLRSAFPNVPPDKLEEALMETAEDLGEEGPDNDFGYGLINAAAAYQFLFEQVCRGDYDHDGDVDITDFQYYITNYQNNNCPPDQDCPGDLNGDNEVNLEDLAILSIDFGRTDCQDWF